jgi:tetratricopeptide (TPR) repeat protein
VANFFSTPDISSPLFAQTQALPDILSDFLIALTYKKDFSQQYAQTIGLAGKDTNSGEIESIGRLLTSGLNAFEQGKYEIGIEMFTPMLDKYELEPESRAVALSWRGEAYRLMFKYDQAVNDFSAAILLKPNSVWTIVCRSSAYRKLKRYAQALEDCNRAIELEPENSWAYNSRGETYLSMRRYEEALRDFERAIDIEPSNAWGIASRAKAYRIMHRTQDALKEFNRAIELDPMSSWALASRGLTHRQIGNYEESIADFNQAITLDADSSWVLASRGETYRQIGQYDRALEDFSHATEIDPSNAWAFCRQAEIYLFLKRYEESFDNFERSLALQPNNDWRRFTYSLALKRTGNLEAARENLEIAIDTAQQRWIARSKDYRSCLTLALYCLANEELDKSQQLYEEALASVNLPVVSIREAIRGLEDFLKVFPEHQRGNQIREQLLSTLQDRKEKEKSEETGFSC